MLNINLTMRTNKIAKTGIGPIYLRLSKDRKTCYMGTGLKIHKSEWDEDLQRVTRKHPNSSRMNKILRTKRLDIEDLALKLEDQGIYFSAKTIKEIQIGNPKLGFVEFSRNLIEERFNAKDEEKISFGTYRRYVTAINKLASYVNDEKLKFSKLTSTFLKDYMNHLTEHHGNRSNTINSNLRCIRYLINKAKQRGLLHQDQNPFAELTLPSEETSRGFLVKKQLKAIEDLVLPPGSRIELHRDMFVFASYAAGLRIADVLMLKVENFDGQYLDYFMRKNGKRQKILLPEKARQILIRYCHKNTEQECFIFPRLKLDPSETSEKIIFKAISSATAYINKDLKVIAKKTELSTNLSFHVSRHTFGTAAITNGIDLYTVSKLMAHADQKTTRGYAKLIDPILDEAMRRFDT